MTFYDLLWYFTIYSFLGWCSEVIFATVTTGKFVNRGFLNGPVCPIYGFGMSLVLLVLLPFSDNIPLLFIGGALLTSAIELVGGWALKKFFHTTWWDYSNQPFNLGGYICLKFSILWGLCVVVVIRIVHTAIASLEDRRVKAQKSAEDLRAQWNSVTSKLQRHTQRRLLRAFPTMKNDRADEALRRLRAWMDEKKEN